MLQCPAGWRHLPAAALMPGALSQTPVKNRVAQLAKDLWASRHPTGRDRLGPLHDHIGRELDAVATEQLQVLGPVAQ